MADEPHSPHPARPLPSPEAVVTITPLRWENEHILPPGTTACLALLYDPNDTQYLSRHPRAVDGGRRLCGWLCRARFSGRTPGAGAGGDFALLDEAWSYVDASYLGDRPAQQLVTYGAIRGALNELGDPYTMFVEPVAREDERNSLRGNYGGIGANLTRNDEGELILDPIPGNPAEAAGIRARRRPPGGRWSAIIER
jgi:hypothetical protein